MSTVIIPNFNTQKTVNGLNSYQYTVVSAGNHTCHMVLTHRDASMITASIVQTGSVNATLLTKTLPGVPAGSPQSSLILNTMAVAQPGDTLTFVLSSSASIDEMLNTVKADLKISIGGLN